MGGPLQARASKDLGGKNPASQLDIGNVRDGAPDASRVWIWHGTGWPRSLSGLR